MTTANLTTTVYNSVAELADFQFSIWYRPGKANCNADFLSQMPNDVKSLLAEQLDHNIKAVMYCVFNQNLVDAT